MNIELYNGNEMPLSSNEKIRTAQEKVIRGEELTFADKLVLGRDNTVNKIGEHDLKPDHVYRAVSKELLDIYYSTGKIYGVDETDEYKETIIDGEVYSNNRGVDWYLGGASLKYGGYVIECPADKEYFIPAKDNGNGMSMDPLVRHFKSSGYKKAVPSNMITKVIDVKKELGLDNNITR